jgi:hypothetical protein
MAQVTVFKDADITVTVIDGPPPVDQTAEVAALTEQVATLTSTLAIRTAERDALTTKLALVKADVDKAETDAA